MDQTDEIDSTSPMRYRQIFLGGLSDENEKLVGKFSPANSTLMCNTCGNFKHKQIKCPFNVIIEDHLAVELEDKDIDVKAGDIITERFEINNVPKDTFSVKVRKIKNDMSIEILSEYWILVLQ